MQFGKGNIVYAKIPNSFVSEDGEEPQIIILVTVVYEEDKLTI